ncbi:deoxyribose-phosphate aldolase [Salinibaculum rarum]|uniref:deoxyribose-phosphate aldolase n=1 Tax=Salinibaculum rarum TaxID=3058903 RepID=UPI00265D8B7E|nr:deoxyribose-phosphate aldolase [Salinibaculum sp. KK48]
MDDVPARIEHTVLGPTTTWSDVTAVLDTARQEGMAACLPPCYVADAAEYAPAVKTVTVVGFPHGQHATTTKCHEAQAAWNDGADELDVVANLGALREGDVETVERELAEVAAAVPVPVKVIVEAPLLDDGELRDVCQAAVDADADFVKTATGFADGGATVEDVAVMSEYLPVKASGGIGSWERADAMFEAGAERIGASSGDVIVSEYRDATGKADAATDDK